MPKPNRTQPRKSYNVLLASACLTAIIGSASPANAQSFLGTPSVESGTAFFTLGANTTDIELTNPLTVINWEPDDIGGTGEILFQPANSTATFRSTQSPDFAVLNRILPVDGVGNTVNNRAIRFNGNVDSVYDISGFTFTAGSVWFYTPGGIILGNNSQFDVGSLLLSTSAINSNSLFVGNSGTVDFLGTANTNSSIILEAGAQVNALNSIADNSYVAMFAPRIVQGGTVDVDGSVGYIAAERGDLNISSGLFNIAITLGSDDANGVVHTGTTIGDASVPAAANPDARAMYMLAVPKNVAITMLVGGNVGYRAASSASISNGEVVLSAGYNVAVGGTPAAPFVSVATVPVNGIAANVNLTGGTFTSNTGATANGSISAVMPAAGNVLVSTGATGAKYNLNLNAVQQINVGAGNGGAVRVDGNASFFGGNIAFDFNGSGQFVVGGSTSLVSAQSTNVNHLGNSGVFSIDSTGSINAFADANFVSQPGARIRSGGEVTVQALQNISIDDLTGVDHITLLATRNATLNNGLLTASGFGNPPLSISVRAGFDEITSAFDPSYNANLTGNIISVGDIRVVAGGNAIVTGGANVRANDAVLINSGDDIIIQAGASVTAAVNPTIPLSPGSPFSNAARLVLSAGSLPAPLLTTPASPIASIITRGNLNGSGSSVTLTAEAIDGLGGTISAGSIQADINNAPSNAAIAATGQSDDAGLLGGQCLQGNICLGRLAATNRVEIGQRIMPSGVPVQAYIEGGNVNANVVLATARRNLILGDPLGLASTINGINQVNLTSSEGDVAIRNTSLSSNLLQINAASGSLTGNGNLTSANDIGVTIGANFAAGTINTGGQLTTVTAIGGAPELIYTVPGAISVTSYTQGTPVQFQVNAGGAINFGNITVPGTPVRLNAGGDVFLGNSSTAQLITLQGVNAGFTNLSAAQNIGVTATSGNVNGGNASAGTALNVTATGGSVTLGTIGAGTNATVTAANGNISAGSASAAGTLAFNAGGNIALAATTANQITVTAGQNASLSGPASSATSLGVTAGGLASFAANAVAPTINIRSGNIQFNPTAQLGAIGTTQNVNLRNNAGEQMTIGGAGVAAGYSLSATEISRIFANNIAINWAPSAAVPPLPAVVPSVIIDSFALSSRANNPLGNIAANGSFNVTTPATLRIIGGAAFSGFGNSNNVNISADTALQIVSGPGSVALRGPAGALAGTLTLNSNAITAASQSAITDLAALSSPAAINARLDANDGNINDTGAISANIVNLNGGNSIFVQNSGVSTRFTDRRGITANALNLNLSNPDGLIAINTQINGVTGFTTGLQAIPLVNINGIPSQTAIGFAAASTINGCQIISIGACRQQENPLTISQDRVNDPLNVDEGFGILLASNLLELKEFETFGYPPLIDEPVTGTGNDDLWPASCSGSDESCPAKAKNSNE